MEIFSQHTKPFLLCVLYRPPSSSKHICKNYVEVFDNVLSKIKTNSKSEEVIKIGDINCNYLDDNHEKQFKEMLSLNGYFQNIKQPTRTTCNSQTLIDVILSNNPGSLSKNEVIPCTLSDHDAIHCVRQFKKEKLPSQTIKCRDYSNYIPEEKQKHLSATEFSSVYSDRNSSTAWNSFKLILTDVYNKHAPMITKRVKGKFSPWLNSQIKAEMNNRDKLYRIFKNSRSESDGS